MAYRKRKEENIWHWCKNCGKWPTKDFDEQSSEPTSGELCRECQAKDQFDTCNKATD